MLTDRFDGALTYAAQIHRTQTRKGSGVPYVAHLMSVAALVIEHGGDEDQAIAALLHDAVEDQGGPDRARDIAEVFGDRVAGIVMECSDSDGETKAGWRMRKEAYVAGIASKTDAAVLVTTADKLHNARAILSDYRVVGEDLWGRFTGKRDGTLWYYRSLADALWSRSPGPLSEELSRTVAELETVAG